MNFIISIRPSIIKLKSKTIQLGLNSLKILETIFLLRLILMLLVKYMTWMQLLSKIWLDHLIGRSLRKELKL